MGIVFVMYVSRTGSCGYCVSDVSVMDWVMWIFLYYVVISMRWTW